MKEIPLSQGKIALVDDDMYDRLSQFIWYATRIRHHWYAVRGVRLPSGKRGKQFMHRSILSLPPGIRVDHKDGDGLNNTRDNLRPATTQQNGFNRRLSSNSTSGYKGVSWHKSNSKWWATIMKDGRTIYLGMFNTARDAAHAYDMAALELYGDFARLNLRSE